MARGGRFIWGTIDLVVLVVTLAAAAGLVCAFIAPSVNPNDTWFFSYAGLAAPILYLANLFLMLYWAIRWKALFFLPALLLLIGTPKIKTFYHFPGGKNYTETKATGDLKIMTYNVEGFLQYDTENNQRKTTARQIIDFVLETDPDIVCFQEFQSTPNVPEEMINQWLEKWPYRRHYYTISRQERGVWGPAIYSKFPIVSSEEIEFEDSRNGALWAEVLTGKNDTLRVICNHLETTYVRNNDILFLQPENFASDPDKKAQLRSIAQRLRKGFRKRAYQAETIAHIIDSRDIPTLVCGDFNDPPISYSYKTIRGKFRDTFEDKGSGYGYTYKRLYRVMRIDYVLTSPDFETLTYDTPDVEWSDHRPVIATLRKKKRIACQYYLSVVKQSGGNRTNVNSFPIRL